MSRYITLGTDEQGHLKRYEVEVRWTVKKVYDVDAWSKKEAAQKIRGLVDSGEVCVWTDGFEASDDDGEPRISVRPSPVHQTIASEPVIPLPCPRCGEDGARIVHPTYDGGSYVRCQKCRYSPQTETWAITDQEAVARWNKLQT